MLEQISNIKCFDGQQRQYQHASDMLSCPMQFSVFLPPQAQHEDVPVLYWLSGLTCTDQNFVTKAGAQQYATDLGMAIVCPDTSPRGEGVPDDPEGAYDFGLGAGFYVNATEEPWRANYQMYDYITQELPSLVAKIDGLDASRASISGHSMGGHGALSIGLKNPDRYRSISAFSPIVSPTNCPWGQKALSGYLGTEQAAWGAYDSCELIQQVGQQRPILIDQGLDDQFLAEQLKPELLVQASAAANYPITLRMQAGYDHSYFFIATYIQDHLEFHSHHLG